MTTSQDNMENMASYIGEKEDVGEKSNNGDVEGDNKEAESVRGEAEGEIGEEEDGRDSGEVNEEDCSDEEEEEEAEQPKVDMEKKPDQVKVKKQPEVLNLNNEVLTMRKEVKRVRALLSRKLIRQIAGLKNKKGTEAAVEKNQRRVARLSEEIHAMKHLRPDLVTKAALQKNLKFNEVCKNPKSTMSDRAIARIASQPQFKKKIEDIQAALKAFIDERRKGEKQAEPKKKTDDGTGARHSPHVKAKNVEKRKKATEEKSSKEVDKITNDLDKDTKDETTTSEPDGEKMESTRAAPPAEKKATVEAKVGKPASVQKSQPRKQVRKKPQATAQENKPKVVSKPSKQEEESDSELSGEEDKPYFDDSTEERFLKQSSQEESDSDNDFFVGKVSKFKKKKSQNTDGDKPKEDSAGKSKPADKVQCELDELESRLKAKAPKLQTVFCSLSQTKPSWGGRGKPFRGQGKPMGRGRGDFEKNTKFQKEEKGPTGNSKFNGAYARRSDSERTNFGGRGRGDAMRQQDRRGPGGFSQRAPQQALHPSWEASKKRKEQQGQILPFQGKRIKFDDDD